MKATTTTAKTTYIRPFKDINLLTEGKKTITTKNTIIKSGSSLYSRLSKVGLIGISLLVIVVGGNLNVSYANRFDNIPNANPDNQLYVPTHEYLDDIDFGAQGSGITSLIFGEYVNGELQGGFVGTVKGFFDEVGALWNTISAFVSGTQTQLFITQFGAQRFQELYVYHTQGATPQQIYYQLTTNEINFLKTKNANEFTGLEADLFTRGRFLVVFRDLQGDYGPINQWYFLWVMPSVLWHTVNL